MKTMFFYDLETTGLFPRSDRIMQFAGQRTDMNLEPIGDPINILVKLSDDTLPSPYAIKTTGITPQMTHADGVTEAEFAKFLLEQVFTEDTIATGFNSIRFDDEFIRHLFWRNFHDAYEWHWDSGRSRWDILDVVRMTRALRPEGINWPVKEDGTETNRLELITGLNGISHESAHDALSDVNALIDVARLVRGRQPQLYDYLLKMRDKKLVAELVNLNDPKPIVYSSGAYASEFHKTTVVFPIAPVKNGVLVYDLRHDLDSIDREKLYPIVKELHFNKCPAVAVLEVLDKSDGWNKISLSREQIDKNLQKLLAHPEFAEQMREKSESREFPKSPDAESALYDGFLDDPDRRRILEIPSLNQDQLATYHQNFDDPRLPELLIHYKARNYPKALNADEQILWETYRTARLASQAQTFLRDLESISRDKSVDKFIVEELKLYYESIMPFGD